MKRLICVESAKTKTERVSLNFHSQSIISFLINMFNYVISNIDNRPSNQWIDCVEKDQDQDRGDKVEKCVEKMESNQFDFKSEVGAKVV